MTVFMGAEELASASEPSRQFGTTRKPRENHYLSQEQCDRIRRLCDVHSAQTVCVIVGVNPNAITRLKRRGWKAWGQQHRYRPMPDDFPLRCNDMTVTELRRHYGASQKAVERWSREVKRDFHRDRTGTRSLPMLPKETVEAAIAVHGCAGAADALGVHRNTLWKWRIAYGLTIHVRPKQRAKKLAAARRTDWAERYVAERRAGA